jgi:hypothetical protein
MRNTRGPFGPIEPHLAVTTPAHAAIEPERANLSSRAPLLQAQVAAVTSVGRP